MNRSRFLTNSFVQFFLPLVAVIALSLAVRIYADQAGTHILPYLSTYFPNELVKMTDLAWYQYLLPIEALSGRWGPTGFLLVHELERLCGEPGAFYILTTVMVASGYILTWLMFRSIHLAALFGIGLATTTLNYHVYVVSGSVIMLPLLTFVMLFVFCHFAWIRSGKILYAAAMAAATILLALSYEGWLDIVPATWVVFPCLAWRLFRTMQKERAMRCLVSWVCITTVAVVYVEIKVHFNLAPLHPRGGEADLIITYGNYRLLMLEDVMSSYFTLFYTTIATYLPPELFSFSLSLWHYGPDKIVALQDGYHPQATHLTHYNHLFLWRYWAGFALAIALWIYVRIVQKFFHQDDVRHLVYFVLMTCILIGSPSHLLIKWRPMHSAPLLGYQVYLSVIALTFILCYFVQQIVVRIGGWRAIALSALLASDFVYCAYARPALMSCMAQEVFLGKYPDPRQNLSFASPSAQVKFCGHQRQ